MESKFCDGVMNIGIKGGVIRVDFFEHAPGEKTDQEKRSFNHRLLLSPEAFLQTHAAFQQVVDELLKRGVLEKKSKA